MPNEIEEKIQAALDAVFGDKIERVRQELAASSLGKVEMCRCTARRSRDSGPR